MDIAIIGVAGRFPDAKNIEQLYQNLRTGKDSARHLSEKRMKATSLSTKFQYKVFSWLDQIDTFDHKFFNISLAEAQNMDPHQRLILEVVQEMFDSAGYSIDEFDGANTAVFCGDVTLKYYELAQKFDPTLLTGNTNAATAGRIARFFNLRGSTLMVDTNCSSTLVALDLACKEIQVGDADTAIVCGARLIVGAEIEDGGDDLGIMVKDGKTRSFSAKAEGTGAGEAVASILIKPLDKAIEDGDIIYGVVKGTSVNQEAQLSGSLTAPSSAAQAQAIQKAWKKAKVDPLSISYIEPHGSGTKLGDPIEIQGIDLAYKGLTDEKHFVGVSALKSNIGHTDTVAGLSGLIKVLLQLQHKEFFQSNHFDEPNPFIDFDNSVTRIIAKREKWEKKGEHPRRAGVSSFGLSGTNAHVIVEESPSPSESTEIDDPQIITLSGKSQKALKANIEALKDHLVENAELSIADIAHTLNRGRKHYDFRFVTVTDNIFELIGELTEAEEQTYTPAKEIKKLFFIFSDETTTDEKYIKRFKKDSVFKTHFEECIAISDEDKAKTFAFQYATYKSLEAKGISTKSVLGIGIGREVINVIVGQKSLEDGIKAALKCEKGAIPELEKRLKALVERETEKEKVCFVQIGIKSTLVEGLTTLELENRDNLYATVITDSPQQFLTKLYSSGVTVNWLKAHDKSIGRKIKLPAYRFDPIRCWLREPMTEEEEMREYQQYMNPQAAYEPAYQEVALPTKEINVDPNWTPTQQTIARFWIEVLRLDEVTLDDDFFKLGGHSLIATQLIARIEKEYGFRLQFRDVTVFATIKSLAEAVDEMIVAGGGSIASEAIPKAEKAPYYPLSHAQKRLWIMGQLEEGGTSYNLPGAMIMEGAVQVDRIKSALNLLVQRHDSLRTSFQLIDQKAVQVIEDNIDFQLIESTTNENQLDQKVAEFIQPFDVTKAPLLRVELSNFDENKYLFLFDIHHIISDGVSQDVLVRDFMTFYSGGNLPELEIQYKDYAVWQDEMFASGKMDEQQQYWVDRFSDEVPVLELPYDFSRPKVQSYRGTKKKYQLDAKVAVGIKNLAQESGVTTYMFLLSLYNILLSKFSGSEDVTVGSPIAGRQYASLEPILGMFVNTLAMRNFPKGDKNFLNFLKEVKDNAGDAYANQDYPFESLVDKLNLRRDMSRSPLFDTMFSFQSFYKGDGEGMRLGDGSLSITPFPFVSDTSKFDITLEIFENGDTFELNAEYCTDLFTDQTMQKLLSAFESIAKQIVANPSIQLADILILSKEEIAFLDEINQRETNYPKDKRLEVLFTEMVEQHPTAIAIEFGDDTLSYQELHERTNQLANHLITIGVKPNDKVGLIADKSIEMIVGIFGILKSGAAYVPLDSNLPQERLDYIWENSGAEVCLGQHKYIDKVKKAQFIELAGNEVDAQSFESPKLSLRSADPCYIIYTSGSTGKPKGTVIAHSSVVRVVKETNYIDIQSEDRVLQNANFAFDGSIFEIFGPLLNGATLVMYSGKSNADPADIGRFLQQHNISIGFVTTALFNTLVDIDVSYFQHLRKILFGGERVSVKHVQKALNAIGKDVLVHMYGPTESTVYATYYNINEIEEGAYTIPIGKPVSNTTMFVLDKSLNRVPTGSIGELFLGGDGLGIGYLNNPELTTEKFIDNPFGEGKLYRTGDLVKMLKDGNLEFVDRIDNQVKIRGFRIELGEIETVLLEQEGITEALVVDQLSSTGNKVLVAYLVGLDSKDTKGIRRFLEAKLPEYMIPSFYVSLESFPLTANGKVNKKALPDPYILDVEEKFIPPSNENEKAISAIWNAILGLEKSSIDANFFEIGGHSLNATILLGQIHKELGVEIKLRQLFQDPTIAGLEKALSQGTSKSYTSIIPVEKKEKYVTSAAQRRVFIMDQLNEGSTVYNIPGFIRIKGRIDQKQLTNAVKKLIQRHESLRTHFEGDGDHIYQIVEDQVDFNLRFREINGDQLDREIGNFVQFFDLSKAPLFRMTLLTLGEKEHVMMFDMHHIISDGTSMEVLVSDLSMLYANVALKPLPIQYKDFSHWQNAFFESPESKEQESFWVDYVTSHPPVLNLPTDFPRSVILQQEGRRKTYSLSAKQSEAIEKLSKNSGATEFMTMLSLFNVLLSKYSNQDDIIVGTPISGRHHPDVQPLVGMFVNTLVLRNFPASDKSFDAFLQEVKEHALNTFENQDYQFDMLVDKLHLDRDTSRNPLFDVMFIFQNIDAGQKAESGMGEWEIQPLEFESSISKFDLTFEVNKSSEGYKIDLEYSTSLFLESTIDKLFNHFRILVDAITANPTLALGEIALVTDAEKEDVLSFSQGEKIAYDVEYGIQQMVEENASKFPDRIAVSFEETTYTYQALNNKANQLAHHLRTIGVKPDHTISVLMHRSIDAVVALLGIIKAGAAYVAIDPKYPQQRVEYILEDSKSHIVITQGKMDFSIPDGVDMLDFDHADIWKEKKSNPKVVTASDHLAYVIYTSGSTGNPKGVAIEHKNLTSFLHWANQEFADSHFDVVFAGTSFSFDLSIFEIFYTLQAGKRIRLLASANDIPKYIGQEENILINTVPSVVAELLSEQMPLDTVNALNMAGEPIPYATKQALAPQSIEVRNLYGPSEDTTYSTFYKLSGADARQIIGRPLANSSAFVLDQYGHICPVGIPGELCLTGDGVTRGYLHKPVLTSERFVDTMPDGNRGYKTGDLARWLPDGNLEYLGRIDHQVKIRGFRIELGEIETQLKSIRGIEEVVVLDRTNPQEEKVLCAFVVVSDQFSEKEARNALSKALPEYMIPRYFVVLDAIPLTPNGKVNRNAFPTPDFTGEKEREIVAPRNENEEKIINIWKQVLHLETIGIDDHFFEIGGQSLKASSVVNRIQRIFEVRMPLIEVFSNPTVREQAIRITQLSMQKQADIHPVEDRPHYPLSAAQQRIFVLNQFNSESTQYNMPQALEINGKLDIGRLESTFQQLIRRHESLRTRFELIDGKGVQIVEKEIDFSIECTAVKPDEVDELIQQFIRPFDLSEAPLLRIKVMKLANDHHIMMMDVHHIITDGESLALLTTDFLSAYSGQHLDPITLQYKDYTVWQHDLFESGELQKQRTFWLDQFSGELPVLNFPLDYNRPVIQNFEGDHVGIHLSEEVSAKIKQLASEYNTTTFMVLLSVYTIFLHKYSKQDDIIVGTPIAGRPHANLEQIVGMFVNTLALRNYPTSNKHFSDFLKEVTERSLACFEHQELPFEELVDGLNLERDASRNPLFDTMFSYQSKEVNQEETGELEMRPYGVENKTTKFDLQLDVQDFGDQIQLAFTYCTKLFKPQTIERMLLHFEHILDQVLGDASIPLKEISLATQKEKAQIVEQFNDTVHPFQDDKMLHQLFEEQSALQPNAIALVYEEHSMTYAELNEKSNQLAYTLQQHGIGVQDIVAIMVNRSFEMVIGMLAIQKAGGAYLPIDPDVPQERLTYILKDSASKVLLSDSKQDVEIPVLDLKDGSVYNQSSENLNHIGNQNSLAYVIYTSGSTGNPKGVMLRHQGAVNRIQWMKEYYNFSDKEVVLQKTAYTFDVSVWEFFMTLCYGAKLVLCHKDVISNVPLLIDVIEREKVTTLHFVPSMFKMFLQGITDDNKHQLSSIKNIFASGEALTAEYVQQHHQLLDAHLHNLYGPTEASVDVSYYETKANDTHVPIGKPVWNTALLVLDENGNLLPIGVPGELYIGGVQLAEGYLNLQELTDQKFVKHPFQKGERLYRTGDLVKWLPDGNIEFLGRIDFQVKIRGFRIELGDIESQLLALEDITEVAVIDRTDAHGDKYLCAYIVSREELNIGALKSALTKNLPDYMIPSYFVKMESMPLNTSGKLNRRALPAPDESALEKKKYEAPATPMEKRLVKLWQEILSVRNIGINDNFFSLGGDSIKAIQLSALLLKDKLKLDLSELFVYPTIKELAPNIKKAIANIPQEAVMGEVLLTPIQHHFFDQHYPKANHFNQAIMLEKNGRVDIEKISQAFVKVINHHDALRIIFKEEEDQVIQLNGDLITAFNIEEFEIDEDTATEFIEAKASELQASFDLYNSPLLFKSAVFHSDDVDYVMLLAHHLVIDAVSWRIIIEDLIQTYQQLEAGSEVTFQEKTHSYQHWANALHEFSASKKLLSEVDFWKRTTSVDTSEIKVDYTDQVAVNFVSETLVLSEADTSTLLKDVQESLGANITDILLVSLGLAIKQSLGNEKILIDLEGHGREDVMKDVEISRTVGWFTSIYPVLIDTAGDDISEVLMRNTEFIKNIPNKGIGFGVLKYLSNKIDVGSSSSILFNYLGQVDTDAGDTDSGIRSEGFQLSGMPVGKSIADENEGKYLFDVNAIVTNSQLSISIKYSNDLFVKDTINAMLTSLEQHIKQIIQYYSLHTPVASNGKASHLEGLEQIITTPVFSLRNNKKKHNLFFFPPAIGFSMVYQDLASQIDSHNIYGVNFLEDDDRWDIYCDELIKINQGQPFVFVGYSGGANLAYKVALTLEKRGEKVTDIIMMDGMREISDHSMTPDEVEEKVFTYIGEEENHPSHQLLKSIEERDRVRKIVRVYQDYINTAVDDDLVSTNIHQILSTQTWEEGNQRKKMWKEIISGDLKEYQGVGDHGEMMNSEYLAQNAKIFHSILANI